MTTRKELIERIQAMQLGTQEMLDAAADDARLIPFDTLFADKDGNARWRPLDRATDLDTRDSVGMMSLHKDWYFFTSDNLRPMTED